MPPQLLSWLAFAAVAVALPEVVQAAAPVSITGELTTFQSALSPYVASGDGSLNGMALTIDPSLPTVQYPGDTSTLYPQSMTMALPASTSQVQFEYTSLIGGASANPNRISFLPAATAVLNVGDQFKVGTLSFTNGYWFPYASVGLTITTHSADAALDNKTFTGNIVVKVSAPLTDQSPDAKPTSSTSATCTAR
jgi:hypothetical protein